MKTIRITGKGVLKLRPDTTRITLSIERVLPEYGDALKQSAERTEKLRDLLTRFGLERTDLKTLDFSVTTEYENYREKGAYKQRFLGYRYRHAMKFEFPSDNERLGRILSALAGSDADPEFRISYTVSDPEAAKNELLGRAVRDAKDKADVLTRAAGVAVKDIFGIDYSWGEIEFETRPIQGEMLKAMTAPVDFDMDIEPDDIEISDTVTVTWEIA